MCQRHYLEVPGEASGIQDRHHPKPPAPKNAGSGLGNILVQAVWLCTLLVWPLLKWVISLDCVFKLLRMMYYWHTPGIHAGATFVLHFSVLVVVTYFVRFYKPPGLS
jgi:hypothetical protein